MFLQRLGFHLKNLMTELLVYSLPEKSHNQVNFHLLDIAANIRETTIVDTLISKVHISNEDDYPDPQIKNLIDKIHRLKILLTRFEYLSKLGQVASSEFIDCCRNL